MGVSTLYRKHRIFFGFAGIVFIASAVAFSSQYLFRIEHIEVTGEDISIEVDRTHLERNLLFFPTQKFAEELLHRYPILEFVYITKKFPQTLQISIKKYSPVAAIENETQILTVSRSGVILGTIEQSGTLPLIRLPLGALAIGEKVTDGRLIAALAFIDAIGPSLFISFIDISSESSLIAKSSEMNIIFPQDDTISTRAATLQRLVAGFRIKGKLPTTIDLRFDKPVIK